jgi:hypothetical protein
MNLLILSGCKISAMKVAGLLLATLVLFACVCLLAMQSHSQTTAVLADSAATIYSSDRDHIWDRLFRLFYIRSTSDGRSYGGDELDPYLWDQTHYLLEGPSHQAAQKLMGEFLQTHAERLITDPLRRALFQRDLLAVYDWLSRPQRPQAEARRQLLAPLGEIIRRLALNEEQIKALPDNYQNAIQTSSFPRIYDATHRDAAFLPDLFNNSSPWVCVGMSEEQPVAPLHLHVFAGRSVFVVFLRLPGERKDTLAYLDRLHALPSRWVPIPGDPPASPARTRDPQPPQFPIGTQLALVRQMVLLSDRGKFVATHITESVQLRAYRGLDFAHPWPDPVRFRAAQDVFEFKLDRRQLLAGASGLRAINSEEKEFPTFLSHGIDFFESHNEQASPVLNCVPCHYDPGVQSFISLTRAHFGPIDETPPVLVESTPLHEAAVDMLWRPQQSELNTYLGGAARSR